MPGLLTNNAQPPPLQPHDINHSHSNPQRRLGIQRQPKEPAVRLVLVLLSAFLALENPCAIAGGGIDFVPPAEADETAAGDVFQVVEIDGEEEGGEDEDEDAGRVRKN